MESMTDIRTLMAVHAHPDDESSSTGGVLAKYSAAGVRTVVVTCTNGEFGDGAAGAKPGQDGHDAAAVAETRLAELRDACKWLGVAELELLGYHDSGMPDWDYKDRPEAFWNAPLSEVAGRIAELIERYRPQVVISYDPQSVYQHPDHVHAARAAAAAVSLTGIPAKFYLTAMRRRDWEQIFTALRERGMDLPDWTFTEEEARAASESEARITTSVDITGVMDRKRSALLAHASQISESWFSQIPEDVAVAAFGHEHFIRDQDRTGAAVPETDLFAGI
jgi:LmbE family N-acetylglucosaminyl deacetylase